MDTGNELAFGSNSVNMNAVAKPIRRSRIRQVLGKEYFCLKEKLRWKVEGIHFAQTRKTSKLPFEIIRHNSVLLRQLKDVDMRLQQNKITNLKLAIACIDGIVIKPGETFSIWKLVGRPTKSRGFLPGLTLSNGQLGEGTGGGLCQLGNLIYWMAIHTRLTVTKRWRHSYDVFPDYNRTLPFGSGATLSYNYIDLQLRNDTNEDFQLNLWLSHAHLNGAICASIEPAFEYEVFEREHRFELQWWGGYTRHNEIWRRMKGTHEGAELVTSNHAIMMYNPMLEHRNV
jgi:vancomycin resistance protein VanW